MTADKSNKSMSMKISVPTSVSTGLYVITGRVFVLELEPVLPAPYRAEISNMTVEGVAQLKDQNGKLIIDGDPEINIEVGEMNIKMDNLFGGKADDLVDKFVDQNTDKFVKDFQPQIAKSVSSFMKGFFNTTIANIDLDAFESS